MWSDEINKKILEAENSEHSSHNDKAWKNMETLLDKHLPLKKKRRRFIILLFPLLLGAGTAIYFIQKGNKDKSSVAVQKDIPVQQPSSPGKPADKNVSINTPSEKIPGSTNDEEKLGENVAPAENKKDRPVVSELKEQQEPVNRKSTNRLRQQGPGGKEQLYAKTKAAAQPKKGNNDLTAKKTQGSEPALPENTDNLSANKPIKSDPAPAIADTSGEQKLVAEKDKEKEKNIDETIEAKKTPKKTKRSFGDKFSLNFSFGPDISSVGIDNPGKLQLQYGIGASYAFSKNFSVRTGFYAGDKKYTADSADYHPPYRINNLQKIEADCFIYEIPLTLVYSFDAVKKHNWFIAGGLSSYIMKKETYDYYYKNSWGQPQQYSRTYKNENKHLFSVVNLSGGYQYHFTDRLSLLAEPYVKIPVDGIGVGKVKLSNAGVLFTVGFKPFLKK